MCLTLESHCRNQKLRHLGDQPQKAQQARLTNWTEGDPTVAATKKMSACSLHGPLYQSCYLTTPGAKKAVVVSVAESGRPDGAAYASYMHLVSNIHDLEFAQTLIVQWWCRLLSVRISRQVKWFGWCATNFVGFTQLAALSYHS